jgi:hypothetical protein
MIVVKLDKIASTVDTCCMKIEVAGKWLRCGTVVCSVDYLLD